MHHSDRGCTYASFSYQKALGDHQIKSSMSRKGNCYDNAAVESFFGRFKSSTIKAKELKDQEEVQRVVFEYIEIYYNNYRKHSSLGYQSPREWEQKYFPPHGGKETSQRAC